MKLAAGVPGLVCVLVLSAFGADPWTLEQAITHTLSNSPDARIARQRILVAQAGLSQARAAFSPQLQFQSSYLRTDNPMLAFGSILNQHAYDPGLDFNDVPDQDNANVKGMLTMPLYAGGRNAAMRDAARAGVAAAREVEMATRNLLAFEVARAFHTVTKTREFIKATEAGVRAFETNLAFASRRMEVGTLLKSDVLDVEVRLAQAREDAVRARNAHVLALRALRNLMGLEEGEIEIAEVTRREPAPPASGGVAQRPELAASAHRLQVAEAEIRRAAGGYKPRVSAFGSLDYDYGTVSDEDGGSYTAGVLLQWDLWDGQNTKARRAEAVAQMETAREEDRKLRLGLGLELEQARLAVKEAGERLAVTDKSVAQAVESVNMTRNRFEQGLALATQLIDAETALLTARVRRAEAEADSRIAQAALRKALGLSQLEPPAKP